jgi:homoserine dehydrogenase
MNKKTINLGIIGFGNIGSHFYKILETNKKSIFHKTGKHPFIKYICTRNFKKKRKIKIPKNKYIKSPEILAKKKDVDIIIELVGGAEGIAKKVVSLSLKNKKHVITANKSLMAKYGDQLAYLAQKNKVNLEYEASVAGGVPIIRSIKDGLIANRISKIYGILNGTTNFILSEMEKRKKEFLEILIEAKKLGFAETNPISDLNGNDAADKIRILSSLAFNKLISKNKIHISGIQNINLTDIFHAKNLGYKIKLLAISEIINNKLLERVHPCLILNDSYIAKIDGVLNAVIIDGLPIGRTVLQGEGAGPGPTCSALISDLCSIMRGNIKHPFGASFSARKKIAKFDILKRSCSSYIRIEVKDLPGVLSSITQVFARNKISIKNLVQVPDKKNKKASIAIITHSTQEKNYRNLLKNLLKNKHVIKKPTFIRTEKI